MALAPGRRRGYHSRTPAVFVMGRSLCGEPMKTRRGPLFAGRCCKPTAPPHGGGRVVIQTSVRRAPTLFDGFPIRVPHGTGGGPFLRPRRTSNNKTRCQHIWIDSIVWTGGAKGRGGFEFVEWREFCAKNDVDSCACEGIIRPTLARRCRPGPSVGRSMISRKTDPGPAPPHRPTCSFARNHTRHTPSHSPQD